MVAALRQFTEVHSQKVLALVSIQLLDQQQASQVRKLNKAEKSLLLVQVEGLVRKLSWAPRRSIETTRFFFFFGPFGLVCAVSHVV